MITHTLSFDIDPRGKGRPCFTKNGHAYTPDRTRAYENAIAVLAKEQFHQDPFAGPLSVAIDFYMPTKDKKRWIAPHTMRPDLDNLCKAVIDGLNGIVWQDDSIIARIDASKHWAAVGGVEVAITELGMPTLTVERPKQPKDAKLIPESNETISADEYLALAREGKGT